MGMGMEKERREERFAHGDFRTDFLRAGWFSSRHDELAKTKSGGSEHPQA